MPGNSTNKDSDLNLVSVDSKQGGDYQSYYKKYMPDVKNWSDKNEVSDAFMKEYAGSYAAQNKSDENAMPAMYMAEYANSYVPKVKNMSDNKEWAAAFKKINAGSTPTSEKQLDSSASLASGDVLSLLSSTDTSKTPTESAASTVSSGRSTPADNFKTNVQLSSVAAETPIMPSSFPAVALPAAGIFTLAFVRKFRHRQTENEMHAALIEP